MCNIIHHMDTLKKPLPKISELAGLPKEELIKIIRQYLDELCAHGVSKGEISKTVGLSRVSIWRIRNGMHKTTHFDHGIKIANLHEKVLKQKHKEYKRLN